MHLAVLFQKLFNTQQTHRRRQPLKTAPERRSRDTDETCRYSAAVLAMRSSCQLAYPGNNCLRSTRDFYT